MSKNKYTEPDISPKNPTAKDIGKDWFVWFRFFDDSTGKWKLIRKKGGINYFSKFKERLVEANALKSQIKDYLNQGWNPLAGTLVSDDATEDTPLIVLIEDMFLLKTKGLRVDSVKNYRVSKNYFVKWLNDTNRSKITLSQFFPYDPHKKEYSNRLAHAFLDWLAGLSQIGNTTWNNYKQAIKFLFNMFVKRKMISENPFLGIKNKTEAPTKNHPFTDEELEKIWAHLRANNTFLYKVSLLLYYCYIRPIEITRIQIKEVQLDQDRFALPASKTKNRKARYPKIPPRLKEEMARMQIEKYPSDYFLFGRGWDISVDPIRRTQITDAFTAVFKKLGITDRNLYSFKHTGVINAYRAGVKIKAIKEQCDHATLDETDNYMRSLGIETNDEYKNVDY